MIKGLKKRAKIQILEKTGTRAAKDPDLTISPESISPDPMWVGERQSSLEEGP